MRINTERWGNYGTEIKPYWKINGNTEFIIRGVDSEELMYLNYETLEEIISNMISEVSNSIHIYAIIDWELIFEEPIELSSEIFHANIENKF
jgi:hypothetical protein